MGCTLKILVDGKEVSEMKLADGEYMVGRSRSAAIKVDPPDVSGHHLMLRVQGDQVTAENLSSHGTMLENLQLDHNTTVTSGQCLKLGKSLKLFILNENVELMPKSVVLPAPVSDTVPPVASGSTSAPTPLPSAAAVPEPSQTAVMASPLASSVATPLPSGTSAPTPLPSAMATPLPVAAAAPVAADETVPPSASVTLPHDPDKTMLPPQPGDANKTEPPQHATEIRKTAAPSAAQREIFETNALKTRVATAEEMDFLRRQDVKRSRGRYLWYVLGAFVLLVLGALVYYFRPPPPEAVLSWPYNAQREEVVKLLDPVQGGYDAGRFTLVVPDVPGLNVQKTADGNMVVTSRIGRDRDVPLRVILSVKTSPAFLHEDRIATLKNWMKEVSASGGHWNFNQPSDLFFIGQNNGLPCISVAYRREADNQSWYGEALFFRNGNERIVRQAEIPSNERIRGENLISNTPFLHFSPAWIKNHWEGSAEQIRGDSNEVLNEARLLLSKMSPVTWNKTFVLLRHVLTQATLSGNQKLRDEALGQLRLLRDRQLIWYNAQRIAYLKEISNKNEGAAARIKDSCEAVFCSDDDLRYLNIRRNIWE